MQKIRLAILIGGTVAMMVVMSKTGASLKTPATPMGILNLELPFTTIKAKAVLTTWQISFDRNNTSNIQVAKKNTWWDFGFILFYSALLFTLTGIVSRKYKGGMYKTGTLLQKAVLTVALFDVVENIGMFLMLDGTVNKPLVLLTSICSALKWILVLLIIFYILSGAASLFFVKRHQ